MDHLSHNPYYPLSPYSEDDPPIDLEEYSEIKREHRVNNGRELERSPPIPIPKNNSLPHKSYAGSPPLNTIPSTLAAIYPDRIPASLTLEQWRAFEVVMKSYIKAKLIHDKSGRKMYYKQKYHHHRRIPNDTSTPVIASHSIILVNRSNTITNRDTSYVFRFLVGKRRDSIERSDFIRGLYSCKDIFRILSLQTQEERFRSLNYSFEEQWLDYWPLSSQPYHVSNSKVVAQHAFELILPFLRDFYACLPPGKIETEWMFPRGRSVASSGLDTAIREFEEETELSLKNAAKINIPPFKETYYGSDGRIYSTTYYIYETREMLTPRQKRMPNIIRPNLVSNDFEQVAWLTLDELRHDKGNGAKLNPARIGMIEQIILGFDNIPFMVIPIPRTYSLLYVSFHDNSDENNRPQTSPPISPRSTSAPPTCYS
jgi:8-oxo-dGTP pyrophosphatase MutT (NUDIX family)